MGVRCNKAAVACFKLLSRYLSRRDSKKPRKYAVNKVFVPLKIQTAHSRMQFSSETISFDFSRRFIIIIKGKVKASRYRPGVAQRVPGS